MLKTSRNTVLRSVITNIYSKFRCYTAVVVRWGGWVGDMGGWEWILLIGSQNTAAQRGEPTVA